MAFVTPFIRTSGTTTSSRECQSWNFRPCKWSSTRYRGTRQYVAMSGSSEAADTAANTRHSLAGRYAVITGGNRGIGEAISLALAAHGANIVVVARDEASSNQVIQAAKSKFQVQGFFVPADLADEESTENAATACLQLVPQGIDILVNNAGIALLNKLETLSVEQWDTTMAVNLRAPFIMAKVLVQGMISRKKNGKVINISSVAGNYGLQDHAAYCASKGGINMLTKVMAVEWGRFNIQTNSVCPTVILTDMGKTVWGPKDKSEPMLAKIPMNRFGYPFEVADLVAFLASDAASMINGQVISVDGGFSAM